MVCYLGKILSPLARLLLGGLLAILFGSSVLRAQDQHGYASLFSEEVITVSRERDGILPGTLRSALIQANSIRAQNSFTLVKIVFDPGIGHVRITKGPLPEIDGSLTTLDCARSQAKVVLEYVPPEDNAGEEPGQEAPVITLSSNGNVIRNCHLTGAVGPGILIRGNRNIMEQNVIGYHADVPETALPPSALLSEPKTNGRAGITLGRGANENVIQHNLIVGNPHYGVMLEDAVGAGNKIIYNAFMKNSGQPIKTQQGSQSAMTPAISKITQMGDTFYIEGTSNPRAHVQIYLVGEKRDQIEMLVAEGQDQQKNNSATFSIATKSKGFTLGKTQVVALAHGDNLNTSEFSDPIIVGIPEPAPAAEPPAETATEDHEPNPNEENADAEPEPSGEPQDVAAEGRAPAPNPPQANPPPSTPPQGSKTGKMIGGEPDTVINLHGQGDGGSGSEAGAEKQNSAMGMGN